MDFLEYGMKNEKSSSAIKRVLAKGALAAARKQADLYEAYLNRKAIEIPEDPAADEEMLRKIREQIAGEAKA